MSGSNNRQIIKMVERVQQGEPRAFTELYQSFFPEICSYISNRYGLEASHAEDIAQEVFLQVFKKIDQLKKPENFRVWVYQITNRTLLNDLRRNQSHNLPASGDFDRDGLSVADTVPLPEDQAADRERNALVHDCMDKLSEPHRSVLNLYYGAELGTPEIAWIRNSAAGTVRNQLMAARRNLRTLLEQEQQDELLYGTIPGVLVTATGKPSLLKRLIAQISSSISSAAAAGTGGATASTGLSTTAKLAMGAATLVMVLSAGGASPTLAHRSVKPVTPQPQPVSKVVPQESSPVEVASLVPVVVAEETPAKSSVPVANDPVAADAVSQPAPPAERADPVITLAQPHISTPVGVVLSPEQILSMAGAQATDADGKQIPVALVGYDPGVFQSAATYAMTVIARDSQGIKAWSRVVFVDVR